MELGEIIENSTIYDWCLLALFVISSIIQLGYYLLVFMKLPLHKPVRISKSRKGISIVICAKNEMENLENFLPKVLEQDYPEYEVVVVNDSSTDETEQLLSELSVHYNHLRYTSIPSSEKFLH